jgi:hypothetical protein
LARNNNSNMCNDQNNKINILPQLVASLYG